MKKRSRGKGPGHRSDNFNEFVTVPMGQHKYDATFRNNFPTCGPGVESVSGLGGYEESYAGLDSYQTAFRLSRVRDAIGLEVEMGWGLKLGLELACVAGQPLTELLRDTVMAVTRLR